MNWNWMNVTPIMMQYPSRVFENSGGTIYQGWKYGEKYAVQRTRTLEDGTIVNERTASTVEWDEIETADYVEIDYRQKDY